MIGCTGLSSTEVSHLPPFVIFGLPRSRTAWLSRFLSYGDWVCGHDELRHMRTLDDVSSWFRQPFIGAIETAAAPWWRLLDHFARDARIAVVRRPINEVVDSFLRLDGVRFDRPRLEKAMWRAERKLDQICARLPNVMEVTYEGLSDRREAAALFRHCLGIEMPSLWHARWDPQNVQIDFRAMMRHFEAYRPAMDKLASVAKHQTLAMMQVNEVAQPDSLTIQTECFDSWLADAPELFDAHLVQVGEAPGDWKRKNIPLMRQMDQIGAMQIVTARSNGRMFGYLMTLVTPSLVSEGVTSALHTTIYADPSCPGLGLKMQRAAMQHLQARGVQEIFMQAGTRGSGERIDAIFRRLGALECGRLFRIDMPEAA